MIGSLHASNDEITKSSSKSNSPLQQIRYLATILITTTSVFSDYMSTQKIIVYSVQKSRCNI